MTCFVGKLNKGFGVCGLVHLTQSNLDTFVHQKDTYAVEEWVLSIWLVLWSSLLSITSIHSRIMPGIIVMGMYIHKLLNPPMQMQTKSSISLTWSCKCARKCLNTQCWCWYLVNVSWCTCIFHRDCRHWFNLTLVLVGNSAKPYNSVFLEFWYPWTGDLAAILDFYATKLLLWVQLYRRWTNHTYKRMEWQILLVLPAQNQWPIELWTKTNVDTHFASWCLMPLQ